ncbi:adenosylcobinamide-phosphate synthase CbiB [Bradyrhizobium sp. LHD-71]|uniref:adenosylcobinamide-phosphate synthase CbiB n=1 Tax=Bradyrhizobium sp. LHD-71 TaxID=3072141 RepID=UPI00280F3DBA|nr:adenosylcobinamide-phosphate synthase CbiB [Bradyrhizobium sp. LHD-71]MDQ8729716.1 adenosylcobinamide-phosphate synthase CbiB [Bradyrhizobium sp. LHD-71]
MLFASDALLLLVGALAIDALFGDPPWLWRRLPHPIVLMGAVIDTLDRLLNHECHSSHRRRLAGVVSTVALIVGAGGAGYLAEAGLRRIPGGEFLLAGVAAIFIAQRSLYDHVARVHAAFGEGGLAAARNAVAMIVGREPSTLDESGVCRAAIESCAENFSDGVVAPAFWFALFGLPGLLIYKIINTADSMVGHRTARHEAYGWAAARLDDGLNLIPARLSSMLLALSAPIAGGTVTTSLAVIWRDARKHRSPNAGWPESAMAGALGIALAGPRQYAERRLDDPFLHEGGRRNADADDIRRALHVFVGACALQAAAYALLAALF